jgi:tRNA A-37 threonylcarbamoyl transferase component Bud32
MASIPDPYPTRTEPRWGFLAPPQGPGELGRLGPYRVLKLLGQGSMGMVFQAEDVQLRRLAALKVMRPDFAAHEQARARFLREARAAAALKHDHVVTIYQVGEEAGVPFLAMEFLNGKSPKEWLRPDRRASVPETLTIAKQIARGLAAAHAAGLIHRDIKPANLWLEAPKGRVKILDFGLARLNASESAALTQDGAVLGTPAFMAPEQARGEVVDQRCDLFSLGCVLYRMVTGRLPFQGNTVYAVLAAVASETPPAVRALNPRVPPRLEGLINRLLTKSPEARPGSAQTVLSELQDIEKDLKPSEGAAPEAVDPPAAGVTTTRLRPLSRRSWVVGIVALIALVLGTVAVVCWAPEKGQVSTAGGEAPPEDKPSPPPPAHPAPVDLVPLIDVKRDAVRGRWLMTREGQLIGRPAPGDDRPLFALVLPWEPPPEYRLKFTVTRLIEEKGFLSVEMAAGSGRFGVAFDVPWKDKLFTGLGIVDGRFTVSRPDARVGRFLPGGRAVDLVCTVGANKVSAEADGREIYQWSGAFHRLSRRADLPLQPLVLVGANRAVFAFENIVLEPLGPSAGQPLGERK